MTLIHLINAALEMTTVGVNDESILNIVTIVLWLPDCVEGQSVNILEFHKLARLHHSTVICYPFKNCMTVWIS